MPPIIWLPASFQPRELTTKIILDVLKTTDIMAIAGIGTNLYLNKIAMDIQVKHIPADQNGVKIAELDEMSYRRALWSHRLLTDFWRVGKGYAKKLEEQGLFTMGDMQDALSVNLPITTTGVYCTSCSASTRSC